MLYLDHMAFRHRGEYDETVPRSLHDARAVYDQATEKYEREINEARTNWGIALAAAIEAGMSYQEIVEQVGVSHSSISRAIKQAAENQKAPETSGA